MKQRYVVTRISNGELLLDMEFVKAAEAITAVRALFSKGLNPNEISVAIMTDEGTEERPDLLEKAISPTSRKPRSDAGKTHGKKTASQPARKLRARGQYFVCSGGEVKICPTKQELDAELELLTDCPDVRVFQGRELKFERRVKYILEEVNRSQIDWETKAKEEAEYAIEAKRLAQKLANLAEAS